MKPDTREKAVIQGAPSNKDKRRNGDEEVGNVCLMEQEIQARKEERSVSRRNPPDDPDGDGVVHVMENELLASLAVAEGEATPKNDITSDDPDGDGVIHVMQNEMRDAILGSNIDQRARSPEPPAAAVEQRNQRR